ncbi:MULTISPECIES: wax ester/triacylglycerol synthase family O-acyltransferase [Gordonia]|uniref:Diacylglycerol O-acyltransferase n=2 Tax=Gordoniaceae TaxID=85026 RepID=A0AAE4U8M9_9ACTN|nr:MULTISPECIES: wax ester/triacylglycerol synthase family O-acyltransferase [Gordonia]ATD72248.1 wax ester/triacylglycerol synthase family O-acyltransferase [Gordonia sp. 1D]KAF0969435.1 putative diacylglycerol O-acyltransferase [Gordonia sp. YY1]MCR8895937.1 wax ester/triacylglycerol synthase family O-acyltransferase [Gordonia sp. GONU]MCZ4578669.1 wax ester/triacylglycerol synthase family O-acyltransferase [Gordonia amicalis]MCZ4651495.1 wax ester/triacylglycerol synthase family O-acyltrans
MQLMDPMEAALMSAETLVNPIHVAALMIFSPPDDAGPGFVDDLYTQGLIATDAVDPRLARRPHIGVDTLGLWTWEQVEVNVVDHVRRLHLPPGGDDAELWRLIGDLHAQGLSRSRPLWQAYLIGGLSGGRFAFYIKIHHALVDGVAGMQMIADSLSGDPDRRDLKPFYAASVHSPRVASPAKPSSGPHPLTAVRSAAGLAKSSLGFARSVVGGQRDLLVGALQGRVGLPLSAPFVRFNGRVGPDRAVVGATFELSRVRAIRVAADVTVNDVLTAVISGVLRDLLAERGELPRRSLVGLCPISVRVLDDPGQTARSNAFGLETCSLATDVDDPVERLATIHRAMDFAKKQVAAHGGAASLALVVPNVAQSVVTALLPFGPKRRTGYNLPISTLRGPAEEMYYNGARLDSLFPISTVFAGLGLNITVYSHGDKVSFGCVAGREMLPDVEPLIPLAERVLAELETAYGLASG